MLMRFTSSLAARRREGAQGATSPVTPQRYFVSNLSWRYRLKIAFLWIESENRFVRLEELTPEEKLLRSIEARDFGGEVESTWEDCSRREFEEIMKRRMLEHENGSDQPEDCEEGI